MAKLGPKWQKISEEIDTILKKNGFKRQSFTVRLTASDSGGKISVDFINTAMKSADGKPTTPYAEDYKRYCTAYGFEPGWLDIEFMYAGQMFKLNGFNMKKRTKLPSLTKVSTGQDNFIGDTYAVKSAIELWLRAHPNKKSA